MKQLSQASGFPERSIRQYVLEGFVPRAEYRGKDTVYGESQLIALRAIEKLREEQRMFRLKPLRAWFAGKTPAEIESFVTGVPIAPPVEEAPVAAAPEVAEVREEEPAPEPLPLGERWTHVALVPGMVLLVKEGAPEVVVRLAGEIRAKYGMG